MTLYESYRIRKKWNSENIGRTVYFSLVNDSWFVKPSFLDYSFRYLRWFGFDQYDHRGYDFKSAKIQSSLGGIIEDSDELIEEDSSVGLKGVISELDKKKEEKQNIIPRKNFDKDGSLSVSFVIPESLTRWKMLGFAHTKDLKFGFVENELITQKEMMVTANAPRFFREGDTVNFSVNVSNLSEAVLEGIARVEFFDGLTMEPINVTLNLGKITQEYSLAKGGSQDLTWEISIPSDIQLITYRVSAISVNHTDGEEMTIPVLSNKILVTESVVLAVKGKEQSMFTLNNLINSEESSTLINHNLTFEFTSDPTLQVIESLPYLMESTSGNSEQVFNRFYANSFGSHILNSNQEIKKVLEEWSSENPKVLLSNLEKNKNLKNILLEETPWVRDAKDESQRKRNIALLFDEERVSDEKSAAILRLKNLQNKNGSWPWFQGMGEDRYMTQIIVTGFGKLNKFDVVVSSKEVIEMVKKGLLYADNCIKKDYENLLELDKKGGFDLEGNHLTSLQIQYLYMRSFYTDEPVSEECLLAYAYYLNQAKKYWNTQNTYLQGMIALTLSRAKADLVAELILRSFEENAIVSDELGTYWKFEKGYYWYQSPVESQTMMVEVFEELSENKKILDGVRLWLIKNKQTNSWGSTKATADACYALLMNGTEWVVTNDDVKVIIAGKEINTQKLKGTQIESRIGYIKTSWLPSEIIPEMGIVKIEKETQGVAFGALYWQYLEELDKITSAETPLKVHKSFFVEKQTAKGLVLEPIIDETVLTLGDRVIVKIILQVDRSMSYVEIKDVRSSALEPENVISTYKYRGGLSYYESTKDASTHFFVAKLPKGTFVFEYPLRVTHKGSFSNGVASVQCMYAPEFLSHSESSRLMVK